MPKNDFTSKMKDFYNFLKNASKCGQFAQNICCHRLWKVAQRAINCPIWSTINVKIYYLPRSLVFFSKNGTCIPLQKYLSSGSVTSLKKDNCYLKSAANAPPTRQAAFQGFFLQKILGQVVIFRRGWPTDLGSEHPCYWPLTTGRGRCHKIVLK